MASFAKFTTFAAFAKSLGKILSNSPFSRLRAFSPVSPNLPYSPLSPKAFIKFCQICHFRHCMASFAKFTTFAAFAKSLSKILSNSPFSRLRAFLDISGLLRRQYQVHSSTVIASSWKRFCAPFLSTVLWKTTSQHRFRCSICFSEIP